jgi:hypothetical protein
MVAIEQRSSPDPVQVYLRRTDNVAGPLGGGTCPRLSPDGKHVVAGSIVSPSGSGSFPPAQGKPGGPWSQERANPCGCRTDGASSTGLDTRGVRRLHVQDVGEDHPRAFGPEEPRWWRYREPRPRPTGGASLRTARGPDSRCGRRSWADPIANVRDSDPSGRRTLPLPYRANWGDTHRQAESGDGREVPALESGAHARRTGDRQRSSDPRNGRGRTPPPNRADLYVVELSPPRPDRLRCQPGGEPRR